MTGSKPKPLVLKSQRAIDAYLEYKRDRELLASGLLCMLGYRCMNASMTQIFEEVLKRGPADIPARWQGEVVAMVKERCHRGTTPLSEILDAFAAGVLWKRMEVAR